ncbi:SNF1-interacting protein [Mucor circinelloides]
MGANASKQSGNSKSSKSGRIPQQKIEDLVDLGAVFPNGLYPTTEQDYDPRILQKLIVQRKIAPFYKGLPDAPETVTAATLSPSLPVPQSSSSLSTISTSSSNTNVNTTATSSSSLPAVDSKPKTRPRSASQRDASYDPYIERKKAYLEKMKQREKMLYNDAVECPICFLYYPANINYSRCCDQPICTECFVQIHRPIETPSVPATCPFCMEENYGILYESPAWSEKFQARSRSGSHSTMTGTRHTTSGVGGSDGPRRESVDHKNPDVVLVDHIRPNWDKTTTPAPNPVRAVSRRNSASNAGSGGSRHNNLLRAAGVTSLLTRPGRSASSAAATEYHQHLNNMRDVNMDLEDWMVMEAIRLSLAEQEENDRKEALKKSKEQQQQQDQEQSTSSTLQPPMHLFDQSPTPSSSGNSTSS